MIRYEARRSITALVLILGLAAPLIAAAQAPDTRKSGVSMAADHLQMHTSQCLASWSGAAEALLNGDRLRADTINIYYLKAPARAEQATRDQGGDLTTPVNCSGLDRMEAEGTVYYVTPKEVVRGDHAVYTAANKTIVVTGQVVVTQGRSVLAGTRLVINTDTDDAVMVSDVTGRGKTGRVRGVFYTTTPQDTPSPPSGAGGSATAPATPGG